MAERFRRRNGRWCTLQERIKEETDWLFLSWLRGNMAYINEALAQRTEFTPGKAGRD